MNIHDYQAKEIFKKFGIPTSKGVVILNMNNIEGKISKLKSSKLILKA